MLRPRPSNSLRFNSSSWEDRAAATPDFMPCSDLMASSLEEDRTCANEERWKKERQERG